MRIHDRSMLSRKGFTLVELLVVIGIIALLISILLPSLARARQAAHLLSATANYKQVYNAILFYANENRGFLPRANGNWAVGGGVQATIIMTLSEYLTGGEINYTDDTRPFGPISPALLPVEKVAETGLTWNNTRTALKFHPRAFPGSDQVGTHWIRGSDGVYKPVTEEYPQRKLASIRDASSKIAFWDGGQILTWNLCTEPTAINLDGWRWNWATAHYFLDPPPVEYEGGNFLNRWDVPIAGTENAHLEPIGWFESAVRTRYMGNTVTPVAFFDGHVETRRANEILVREICISRH